MPTKSGRTTIEESEKVVEERPLAIITIIGYD
jgi:hypothetical protein